MNDCKHNLRRNKCHACCEADRDDLCAELARSQEERDALAAHVERLVKWLERATSLLEDDYGYDQPVVKHCQSALAANPETSLAQRIAKERAEAMDWVLAQSCLEENEAIMWRAKIVGPEIQRLLLKAAGGAL